MNIISNFNKNDRCLIISNAAGAGHIQATESLKVQLAASDLGIQTRVIEVYKSVLGNTIGGLVTNEWNEKQKKEKIPELNACLNYQWVDEWLLSIFSFFAFLREILKNDIDVVITTQPVGTQALVRAARVANFINQTFRNNYKTIDVYMVLTELPNKNTLNFLPSLKHLSNKDKSNFKLVTTHPLLGQGEQEADFWKTNAGLKMENVVYDQLPIRKKFSLLASKPENIETLQVKIASPRERALIEAF